MKRWLAFGLRLLADRWDPPPKYFIHPPDPAALEKLRSEFKKPRGK